MIDPNKPVRVFRNWRRGCYNIMQDGRIKASAREVRLGQVEFRVRESGRQRMLRTGRRNVHAYAIGVLLDLVHPDDPRRLERVVGRPVHYDPYAGPSFVDSDTRRPVTHARVVQLDAQGVTYTHDPEPADLSRAA